MDESRGHYPKWNKLEKVNNVWYHLFVNLNNNTKIKKNEPIETE